MKSIKEIYNLINKLPLKIIITFHQKPDADAIGSALALYNFLKQFHHEIKIISPTNWANFLHWLPGTKYLIDGDKHIENCQKYIEKADWIFCLDFNILSRTNKLENIIKNSKAKKILIDHHENPEINEFDYGISIPQKSSTAEMIYDFIIDSGFKKLINQDIATTIYAGILGDTGSFKFSNTTSKVHEIISNLLKYNINHSKIHQQLYDNFSEKRWKFIGYVILNRMIVNLEFKTAIIYVTKEDLINYEIQTGDTEGLVQYPMSIKGIEFVALIIDRTEEIRCSFRSKSFFNVNEFAKKYFNGGGHIMASGGKSSDTLENTIEIFWNAVKENKEILINEMK